MLETFLILKSIFNFYKFFFRNRGKYYLQAAKVRRLIKNDFDRVFKTKKIHAILTPVTTHSAPLFSEVKRTKFREQQRKDDFYTQPANMAGKLKKYNF